jgi:hypothetical protein
MATSKQQVRRGKRGRPGATGPRGEQGRIGQTGKPGVSGPRGAQGLMGKTVPTGKLAADRQKIMAAVQGQIEEVHHELTHQIKRMDSLRRDIDELRTNVARLRATTALVKSNPRENHRRSSHR